MFLKLKIKESNYSNFQNALIVANEEVAIIAIISETFYTRKDWLALSHK